MSGLEESNLSDEFALLWENDERPDVFDFLAKNPDARPVQRLRVILVDQFKRWGLKENPTVEEYLERLPDLAEEESLLAKLVEEEFGLRLDAGQPLEIAEFLVRFPDLNHDSLTERLRAFQTPAAHLESTRDRSQPTSDTHNHKCIPLEHHKVPEALGRYRVERLLGKGGFGQVYLAWDEELKRSVAVKVASQVMGEEDAEAYLTEARVVASLDHPHIVPVYDAGRTDEGQVFVVSKLIEGSDLAAKILDQRPLFRAAVELVANIAGALNYAHSKGLVHRDIKPANVLIETSGQAYLTDFGIALREEDYGKGAEIAGTPAYMSPEQARGEAHLVDGRSDIYSLGVVLYELLTGRRPFKGETRQLLLQIAEGNVKPPRQVDDSIPQELERICLKCLANLASNRYTTAADLAEDLLAFANGKSGQEIKADIRIVPKGLRSFDAADRDFFLELLPGPRNREGLPEGLAFWKSRLEEPDADKTFRVGLMYGPSGCGKSSLVKAGVIPRLDEQVRPVYVEATSDDTEARLLAGLRKACPEMSKDASLKEIIAEIRRGKSTRAGRKVVVIIDQFEQWLHSRYEYRESELADALRQCDGGHVQAVLMIRDDFWMAVSRLFRDLDIPLVERENSAAVDLFDLLHARKVLADFGRAYGHLPENLGQLTGEQDRFLDDAVTGLTRDGKVVSLQLSLFAEMVKGKPWTLETLQSVGGAEGVGVNFLEESFDAATAPPQHRLYQKAARKVLQSLLPNADADIKGHMRSRDELLETSGYAARPGAFQELLGILDGELRLITPTDPEGMKQDDDDSEESPITREDCFYQLTHDFLVPSLCEWLTRKQTETRRGRAELRLEERSALWNAKPERRHLPSVWEWCNIRLFTRRKRWTERQTRMMQRAGKHHSVQTAIGVVVLTLLGWVGYGVNGRYQAGSLLNQLVMAEPSNITKIANRIPNYNRWIRPRLQSLASSEHADPKQQLHARIALVAQRDDTYLQDLELELLRAQPPYVGPIRDALKSHQASISGRLQELFRHPSGNTAERFRVGLALASFDQETQKWSPQDLELLARQMVASNPVHLSHLIAYLQPLRLKLLPHLELLLSEPSLPQNQQINVASVLAEYAKSEADTLANLLIKSNVEQYQILYPVLDQIDGATMKERLREIVGRSPQPDMLQKDRVSFGKRRAGAAITLIRQGGREEIFDALRVQDDPESLTQFVHRCRARQVRPTEILECLDIADNARQETNGSQRSVENRVIFGLLLALGEFEAADIPSPRREELVGQLVDWYATDPSSTIHGASGWLLRQWGYAEEARKIDQTEIPYALDREWFVKKFDAKPNFVLTTVERLQALQVEYGNDPERVETLKKAQEAAKNNGGRIWIDKYGNVRTPRPLRSFYFTFVVFDNGEYTLGSPDDEDDRDPDELIARVSLTRRFAVLDREITRKEFETLSRIKYPIDKWSPSGEYPMVGSTWYDSVAFCRALTTALGHSDNDQCYADPSALSNDIPREPHPNFDQYPRNWIAQIDRVGFRLPTEAEWEVLCRAGMRTMYNFGSDRSLLDRYGWFNGNAGKSTRLPRTLRPNMRGLFDTHGSVVEWCHDWIESRKSIKSEDPHGSFDGVSRVLRGGGWCDIDSFCRSADRSYNRPTLQDTSVGFRVVCTLPSRPYP